MNLQKLVDLSLQFNAISGADKEIGDMALRKQINFVVDEAEELYNARYDNDEYGEPEGEIVKEALDVLVTVVGVLQKMQNRGYDIEAAAEAVGLNNLSKYPKTHEEAMQSLQDLASQGVNAYVSYNPVYDCYVIRDVDAGKVRKPSSYQKVDNNNFKKDGNLLMSQRKESKVFDMKGKTSQGLDASQETNAVSFDMTKVKVGDKLLTRGKSVVEFRGIDPSETTHKWAVETEGDAWVVDHEGFFDSLLYKFGYDIVGFADEQAPVPEAENKGVKSDQGKTQWSYLPIPAVKAVIDVMAYGDTKYPAPDGSNWKRVPDAKKRYYNAAMRHLTSWWDGEQNDPETGYNHLAHACSNLLFLLWFEIKGYPKE